MNTINTNIFKIYMLCLFDFSPSFPDIFYEQDELKKIDRPLECSVVSAIGCSSNVLGHMEVVLNNWRSKSKRSLRVDIGDPVFDEERQEISERLEMIYAGCIANLCTDATQ